MYKEITKCRICGNSDLLPILDLGEQALTGVFPKARKEIVTSGPLALVKCNDEGDSAHCGLVQLKHSYQMEELYGHNYGYRSGLNPSMVRHLEEIVSRALTHVSLKHGDLAIDIGSNDSTLLQAYPALGADLVGIDPTGTKFAQYYPDNIRLIPEFFSGGTLRSFYGNRKAKIITSISMFYDLEDPIDFMQQVYDVLEDDGIWVFEQSYMPTMLKMNAYDTICHEHLEYYGLKQIKWMADIIGFKFLAVELNDVNGGSFSLTVGKKANKGDENSATVDKILRTEERDGLATIRPYLEFAARVSNHRESLREFVHNIGRNGKKMLGYGASTKGNVILQYCGFSEKEIPYIAEVNADKYGSFTPGTYIPIVSEAEARAMNPDYFLVLPWHFKKYIQEKERGYLAAGGKLVFPLPEILVV